MFEAYKVGVTLSLTNKVTAGLLVISKDLAKTQGSVAALQKKLDDLKKTGKKAAYELGAAFAIISPFALAISDAAKLQKEMIGIQQATGATTKQIDSMRLAIEKSAGQTMFSNIDVAKMAKTIGTGTTLTPDQVTALLPEYAKFADVQLLLKGTSPQESVKDAVKLAHTAGHYDADSLREYLNLLNKLSMVIPGGLGEAGHALKYSQTVAKRALGIGDVDMVEMIALLNQLGFSGSRGGTNFLAAATRSIPGIFGSGLLKGKSHDALKAMGMIDSSNHATFFKDGKFNTHLWMEQLSGYVAKEFATHPEALARQDIMTNFSHALGVNGARIASLLADPAALKQLVSIHEKFSTLPSVDATQRAFATESVTQGYENAKTNLTSLLTELGYPLLPDVESGLTKLNGTLQSMITAVHDHPGKVRALTYAFAGLAGSLAFVGTVNLLKFAFGSLVAPLRLMLGTLTTFMLANPVALVSAIVIGTVYAVMHWKKIGPKVKSALAYIGKLADPIWKGLLDLGNSIRKAVVNFLAEVGNGILSGVQGAGNYIGDNEFKTTNSHAFGNNRGYSPPSTSGSTKVTIPVYLDKQKVGEGIADVFVNAMNRSPTSGSNYEIRQSMSSPAWGF
jgi:hypothetical protein